jgi:peptidoglycan/LPS O-acetylase OafA/YrhL
VFDRGLRGPKRALGLSKTGPVDEGTALGAPAASRHVAALDGIRGVAVVWVVLHNATAFGVASSVGIFYLIGLFAHTGWIGVQLFFALSGFLITAGLLDTQGTKHYFRNFYARRALRILPLYYFVLILFLLILPQLTAFPPRFSNHPQASLWLFITNWTNSVPFGFGHFWSLAVEEQFYLIWPLVVFWLRPRQLLAVCVWIAAGALLLRCVMVVLGADAGTIYENTLCRMDALALGGAVACVLRLVKVRTWVRQRLAAIGGAAAAVFAVGVFLTHGYRTNEAAGETIGYSLLAACAAVLVMAVVVTENTGRPSLASPLNWMPLRSFGKYSYAIYVFHNLVHKLWGEPLLVARFGDRPAAPIVFAYGLGVLLISYLLAICSWHFLEGPFLHLNHFFEPRT